MATKFETTACGRCCGSGHYSRNASGSTTCYSCGGLGKTMTKRGKVAQKWFRDAISHPASEVQPGWLVWWPDVTLHTGKWVTVADVHTEPYGSGTCTYFTTASGNKHGISASTRIRAVESITQRDEALAQALAYQATLNASGKPMTASAA